MTAFQDFVGAVESTTGKAGRRVGRHYRLLCPAHDDHDPSLDVSEADDGRPLAICRSHGCSFDDICGAIGRPPHEFGPRADSAEWTPRGPAVAVYDYTDEAGRLLFQVLRTADKQFSQRAPDPGAKRGWRWKLSGVRRVLYRLPEVLAAVAADEAVYVCEGEKDVESLRRLGVTATCNPGGVGKWRAEYADALVGAEVVVIADRDDPGRAHASRVAASVGAVAGSVKVVEPAEGKDATDHLRAGGSLAELVVVDVSAPAVAETPSAADLGEDDVAMGAELFHSSSLRESGKEGTSAGSRATAMAAAKTSGRSAAQQGMHGRAPLRSRCCWLARQTRGPRRRR
jgi:hypothetical protein